MVGAGAEVASITPAITSSKELVRALRSRLVQALKELAECRELLDAKRMTRSDSTLSCRLEDHADVLGVSVESVTYDAALEELENASRGATAAAAAAAASSSSSGTAAAASSGGGGDGVVAAIAAGAGGPGLQKRQVEDREEREKLEEELSMAKALLMLSNVSLSMDLDISDGVEPPASQVVNLKGNKRLLQLLIALKQKVALLNQQYLLLRGDMLYLSHEMSVCRNWIMQSLRTAMQHQSQEHSSLQTRFERLSKVLN